MTMRQVQKNVLVPFDIGVVYIQKGNRILTPKSFSPLRYWGGLYQSSIKLKEKYKVLVPFDIGVVYIIIACLGLYPVLF